MSSMSGMGWVESLWEMAQKFMFSNLTGTLVTVVLLATTFVAVVAPAIRAGLYARDCLMHLCGLLQFKRVRVINEMDGKRIEQILQSRDKGRFLEDLHACNAWAPIYSVESVNHELWRRLKKTVHFVYRHIDYKNRLPDIAQRVLSQRFTGRCDSKTIGGATAAIMFELITGEELGSDDVARFLVAAHEWKKELAVKAPGDKQVKMDFLLFMQAALQRSTLGQEKEFDCSSIHDLSAILQPYIISPIINVPDIFAGIEYHIRQHPEHQSAAGDKDARRCLLLEVLRLSHPFPVLERTLERDEPFARKGTHFFINLDVMRQCKKFVPARWTSDPSAQKQDGITGSNVEYSAIPFGAGPRACIGKHLAMDLLDALLEHFGRDMSPEMFNPTHGHTISGRTNDSASSDEEAGLWQAGIFSKLLWRSISGWQFIEFPNPLAPAEPEAEE
jgi:hypothetical protein